MTIDEKWLTHCDSLTDKLQKETGDARLQLLRHQWEQPDAWDKQVLDIKNELVIHREILMWSMLEPCWYARTIIPSSCYQRNTAFFDRLQNESLGKLIFDKSKIIRRISLKHYRIQQQNVEYHWLTENIHEHAKALWTRMSVFAMDEQFYFYLVEILLPGLLRSIK